MVPPAHHQPATGRIFAIALLLALPGIPGNTQAQPTNDPAAELASFQLADGFEANLFASEAQGVAKPIQIRFDTRGRLWVIGSTTYPLLKPGQEPNDKVLILEDTTRAGTCNKVTVFANNLLIPTGLETTGDANGCYIGEGPNLLLLRDTHDRGQADSRQILLRGFGTGDNHQNINSFRWGPGGELWFCQGLHNESRVETPFGLRSLFQAGIWRLDPLRLHLEGFYGSAAEPQNPWGFVFTDFGEPIELAGNNSSIIYPVPGLIPNTRPDPPTLIWKNGRGRKMSGGEIVQTTHFPEAWQGRLIVGGYINNTLWSLNLADDGAGFALTDATPLLTTTNQNFRPVDVRFGPDGALYIADWFNPIIGHYQASFRHPDRDHDHGRIWRITAKSRPLTPTPKLANATIPDLLKHLGSLDRWTRDFSKRALSVHPPASVQAALETWLRAPHTDLELKEALGVAQSLNLIHRPLVEQLIHSATPGARAYAAATIGQWTDRLENPLALLEPLARDPHPRVRLHCIVAAARLHLPDSIQTTLNAAGAGDLDPFLSYALRQAVHSLKPLWLPSLRNGTSPLLTNPANLNLLVQFDGSPDTLDSVRTLLATSGITPTPQTENLLRILAQHGTPPDLLRILQLKDSATLDALLPILSRNARLHPVPNSPELERALASLASSPSPAQQSAAFRLIGAWQITRLKPLLQEKAATHPAAFDGLLALDPAAATRQFAQRLARPDPLNNPEDWVTPCLRQKGAVQTLITALQSTPPHPANATAILQTLNQLGYQDPALSEQLNPSITPPPQHWVWSPQLATELAAEVRKSGNPTRGKTVFQRANLACTSCHRIANEGGLIGPSLDTLGTAQPTDFIIGAILEPRKEIKEGFEAFEIETQDGDLLTGYRIRSDATGVILREAASQAVTTLRRNQVKSERSLGTLMPPGLADSLSREELRDLVAYLGTLGRPPAKP